jgi:hypothetical protein
LKKVAEMIENAVSQACADNQVSYLFQTPYGGTGTKDDFVEKYFKVSKTGNFSKTYRALNSETTSSKTFHHVLSSGEFITMGCYENACGFDVDINGEAGPNVGGRDIFTISFNANTNKFNISSVQNCGGDPRGASESETAYVNRLRSASISATGVDCFSRIVQDNWEMKY